jgi:hypothetical protein
MDDNDLLSTNQFIPTPNIGGDVSNELVDGYRAYAEQELERNVRENLDRVSLRSIHLSEDTDDNVNISNTNKFGAESIKSVEVKRYRRDVKTHVSIDSRDRNKISFLKPSHFKVFLGKTFYNVKSIRLVSVEFPNTNAVINSGNNMIYWRNQEDIEDDILNNITKAYPVYGVELRIGSYIAASLQTEMNNKLATVKRRNKFGDFHYFITNLDIDTDVVTMTSLLLTQLPNNPLNTTAGLSIITVAAPNHGYENGATVYLVGTKTVAGIPSAVLNGPHVITVINSNTFQFEVNVKAGETVQGGGNTTKSGRIAPFQLLFGEQPNTVAQNIGYPLENSSDRINTYIKSISNFYQAVVTTSTPHSFTRASVGDTCTLSGTNTTPSLNGVRVITDVLSPTKFVVSINTRLTIPSFNVGQVSFLSNTYSISSIINYDVDTVLVETFTPHNYKVNDINTNVTLYNTTTTPSFDGENIIINVLSPTLLLLAGSVLDGGDSDVSVPGEGGEVPRQRPITTHTRPITDVFPGTITRFKCEDHKLKVGDMVRFYNVLTLPSLLERTSGIFQVYSIPDADHFTIDYKTTSFDPVTIGDGTAYVGTGLITVSFPGHGFNKIIDIQNAPTSGVVLQTFLPHNKAIGDTIRVMETDCVPTIDGGGYTIQDVTSDTLTIDVPYSLSTPGTNGVLGLNQNFYLYGVRNVGGLSAQVINGTSFTVRDVIDEDTFTFYIQGSFATSTEDGGGNNVYVSSLLHGFGGVQTNTKNSLLNRSINLQGENYAFLCCPQLATMMNTGKVKDVFARITLDQSPGSMVFSFLSTPKVFDNMPLDKLNELEFSVVNYDGTFYEFNDLDYSFVLEITEEKDITDSFGYSSRRGITNL